jgi:hypothetical protein
VSTTFAWLSDDNPILVLEREWIASGTLDQQKLALIVQNRVEHPDVRVREACRVLLAAMEGGIDGEPHAQRLLIRRHVAVFKSKLKKRTSAGSTS